MQTNIIEVRKRKGIKFTDLAERAGINKGFLSLIERGIYHPTSDEVQRLAAVLGEPVRMWIDVRPRGVSIKERIIDLMESPLDNTELVARLMELRDKGE